VDPTLANPYPHPNQKDFHYGSLLTDAIDEYERNASSRKGKKNANGEVASTTDNKETDNTQREGKPGKLDREDNEEVILPSGTKKGGFVVYRETVELMNALDLEQ
jgi:hypothetical protein